MRHNQDMAVILFVQMAWLDMVNLFSFHNIFFLTSSKIQAIRCLGSFCLKVTDCALYQNVLQYFFYLGRS